MKTFAVSGIATNEVTCFKTALVQLPHERWAGNNKNGPAQDETSANAAVVDLPGTTPSVPSTPEQGAGVILVFPQASTAPVAGQRTYSYRVLLH